MINLRNSPFLWMALLLLFTYKLGEKHESSLDTFLFLLGIAGCVVGAFLAILSYGPSSYYLSTIGISLLILCAGLTHQSHFKKSLYPSLALEKLQRMSGTVEVVQVLKIKETGISIRCRVLSLQTTDNTIAVVYPDKFILVQIRDPDSLFLLPNDQIHMTGWVSPVAGPLNPHSFDARSYYQTLGIRHQMYCKRNEIMVIPSNRFSIQRLTAKWQTILSGIVRAHTSPESGQVINALVWGDRSDMDNDVRDAFADSGAMHVLSVSGMHVAMIYSMFFLLLGAPGEGIFLRRLIRFLLYALAILLYVGLTGACPAVVRAGLMILLYLFGKSMGWNTQVWNLIGFAAFMMLWLNPYLYHNIGFQLSFLAMAGILLYAKPIIRSVACQTKLLHWTWEIVALSLAAQIFIFPVILRVFHQFPLTFITSSIVAIPAGYIVICGTILNVLLSVAGIDILWPLLDHACRYFVYSMQWMAELNPTMNYSLPILGSTLLMGIAIIFSMALIYRWPTGKRIAYSLCCIVIMNLSMHRITQWKSGEIILYHSYKGPIIDIMEKGYAFSIQDCALTTAQVEFPTRGYRCHKDIIALKTICLDATFRTTTWKYENHFLEKNELRILFYDEQSHLPDTGITLTHLILLKCKDSELLENILQQQLNAEIIIVASCPRADMRRITKIAKEAGRSWYDIGQKGHLKIQA